MTASLAFLIGAAPLALIASYRDLKTMKIPNWISIAFVVVFIVLGFIFLPWDTVLWRLLAGFLMLILTFFLNSAGLMGGGDAKMIASSTPYIAFVDVALALIIFSGSLFVTLILHRIAKRSKMIRRATPDWKSWQAGRNFPMGISIGLALIVYLAVKAFSAP